MLLAALTTGQVGGGIFGGGILIVLIGLAYSYFKKLPGSTEDPRKKLVRLSGELLDHITSGSDDEPHPKEQAMCADILSLLEKVYNVDEFRKRVKDEK